MATDQTTTPADVPPWHSYDGCCGCRLGDYHGRKAAAAIKPKGTRRAR